MQYTIRIHIVSSSSHVTCLYTIYDLYCTPQFMLSVSVAKTFLRYACTFYNITRQICYYHKVVKFLKPITLSMHNNNDKHSIKIIREDYYI